MAKTAFENLGAERGQSVSYIEPEKVTLIGRDTKHKTKGDHWAWEKRALNKHDEDIVFGMMLEGVHTPILVVRDGENAIVFDGRQRTINAREANRRLVSSGSQPIRIPFLVKPIDQAKASMLAVILNEHKIEDSAFERASKAQHLIDKGFPMNQVAASFRVDEQTIKSWTSMLSCHDRVKAAFEADMIGITSCARLAKLSQDEQIVALDELLASGDTSIARADQTVRAHRARANGTHAPAPYTIPSKSHLKKILKLHAEGDEDAVELSEEFISAIRWITGDLAPTKIKGLTACMTFITEKKAKGAEDEKPNEEVSEDGEADEIGDEKSSTEFDHDDKPEEPSSGGRKKRGSKSKGKK